MSNRIISFSLWGDDRKYCNGAVANAQEVPAIYPGWRMRVYHDHTVPADAIEMLRTLDVETIRVDDKYSGHWNGLFWRFLPACERGIDAFIVRDTDSRLNLREKAAVDDWLANGRPFHAMRDHIEHTTVPVMGGMWGHIGPIEGFKTLLDQAMRCQSEKGDDQRFLADHIWPLVRERAIVHDRYRDGVLMRISNNEIISPDRATLIKYSAWPFGPDRNDHMPPDEVLLDGQRYLRSEFYEYHPSKYGRHLAVPFPKNRPEDAEFHVGMIVE